MKIQVLSQVLLNKLDLSILDWDKDGKRDGLFKRVKEIEGKSEEQLKLFSNANKTSSYIKNESDYTLKISHRSLNTMIYARFTVV